MSNVPKRRRRRVAFVALGLVTVIGAGLGGYALANRSEPTPRPVAVTPTTLSDDPCVIAQTTPNPATKVAAERRCAGRTRAQTPRSTTASTTQPAHSVRTDEKCASIVLGTCVSYLITETFSDGHVTHSRRDCTRGYPRDPGDECTGWRTVTY